MAFFFKLRTFIGKYNGSHLVVKNTLFSTWNGTRTGTKSTDETQ